MLRGVIYKHLITKHQTRPNGDLLLKTWKPPNIALEELLLLEALFVEQEKLSISRTVEVKILPSAVMRPSRHPDDE